MKTNINKKKKILLLGIASLTTMCAVTISTFVGSGFNSDSIRVKAGEEYQITLDSSNSVSGNGTVTQKTKKGNDISSTYSGATSSASAYSSITSQLNAVLTALDNVVIYTRYGSDSGVNGSCGLNLFCPISGCNRYEGYTYQGTYYAENYSSSLTLFTKWQAFCQQYGTWDTY